MTLEQLRGILTVTFEVFLNSYERGKSAEMIPMTLMESVFGNARSAGRDLLVGRASQNGCGFNRSMHIGTSYSCARFTSATASRFPEASAMLLPKPLPFP